MKIQEAYIAYKDTGKTVRTPVLVNVRAVVEYIADAVATRPDQEQLWVILLDAKLNALGRICVFVGTLDSVAIHPREIFRPALLGAAHSIIVVHNHPSGDPAPSPQDEEVTTSLSEAGELLGVLLTDHVIVGRIEDDPKQLGFYTFFGDK